MLILLLDVLCIMRRGVYIKQARLQEGITKQTVANYTFFAVIKYEFGYFKTLNRYSILGD